MPLDRHRQVVFAARGGSLWMAPAGTPIPAEGAFIGEPWELVDPAVEVPDVGPEDVDGEP